MQCVIVRIVEVRVEEIRCETGCLLQFYRVQFNCDISQSKSREIAVSCDSLKYHFCVLCVLLSDFSNGG